MSELELEYQKLQKRFKIEKYHLSFDRDFLNKRKLEAGFNHFFHTIYLRDRRLCRKRLLSLLHEICHAIQHKEGRYTDNKFDTEALYAQDVEAECFAIDQYEEIYACRFGTCQFEHWELASYEKYCRHYAKMPFFGQGQKR